MMNVFRVFYSLSTMLFMLIHCGGYSLARGEQAIATSSFVSRGLWVWSNENYAGGSVVFDAEKEKHLEKVIAKFKISEIYLDGFQLIQHEQGREQLRAFMQRWKERGVNVQLLLAPQEWVKALLGPAEGIAELELNHFFDLIKLVGPNLHDIHIDLEPHALQVWADLEQRPKIMQNFIELVEAISKLAHANGLNLSMDVPFFYPLVEMVGTGANLGSAILPWVDQLVIMSYRDHWKGEDGLEVVLMPWQKLLEKSNLESEARATSPQVSIALETSHLPMAPEITFFEEGLPGLLLFMQKLELWREGPGGTFFSGLALHHFEQIDQWF